MAEKNMLRRMDELATRIDQLERKIATVKSVLGRSIIWTGQTAGSPLSHSDIRILLEDLEK